MRALLDVDLERAPCPGGRQLGRRRQNEVSRHHPRVRLSRASRRSCRRDGCCRTEMPRQSQLQAAIAGSATSVGNRSPRSPTSARQLGRGLAARRPRAGMILGLHGRGPRCPISRFTRSAARISTRPARSGALPPPATSNPRAQSCLRHLAVTNHRRDAPSRLISEPDPVASGIA